MFNNYTPYMNNYVPYSNQTSYNNYVPNMNSMNSMFQNQVASPQKVDFTGALVNGFNEVKDYAVSIGGMALLLNKADKTFYLKSLDNNGIPIIETYKFDSCTSDNNKGSDSKINISDIDKRLSVVEHKLDNFNPYDAV